MKKQTIFQRSLMLVTTILLLAGMLLPAAGAQAAPNAVPVPKKPNGSTTDTTPKFTWTVQSGATQYQINVKRFAADVYTISIGPGACGASTCNKTPATVLLFGPHSWRVRARVGGVWKAWSVFKAFNIQEAGFDSQFNGAHAGWNAIAGTWNQAATYYWTGGTADAYNVTRHENSYSTLTYEVQMRRNFGMGADFQGIYFRASELLDSGFFISGILFANYETGYYSINYVDGGAGYTLLYESSSLINVGSYNTYKVTANGPFLQFFINGTKVADGFFDFFASGVVGIFMYDDDGQLQVNQASLSLNAPAASAAEADEPGVVHLGAVTLGSGTPVEP